MLEQGFVKTDEKIYVIEDVSRAKPNAKIVLNENTYNKPSKQLNSKSKGMKHWLSVAYNLTIGSSTKKAWKAATILGIDPSDFLSDWQKGDMLEKSESMIKKEKWVQIKTKDGYINAGKAMEEEITVYIDLRTTKRVNGKLNRDSNEKTFTNVTKNYDDEGKLKSLTLAGAVVGNEVVSFYEDPWKK